MNMDMFHIEKRPFDETLRFALKDGAKPDIDAIELLEEWNNPFIFAQFHERNFAYDVSGRVPLRHYLTRTMNRDECLNLFLAIVDAQMFIQKSHLDLKYLLLDSDLIYMDEDSKAVGFICVPATNHGLVAKPLRAYLKELLVNMQYDETESLDYVAKVINYLNQNPKLNTAAMMDYLLSLYNASPAEDEFEAARQPTVSAEVPLAAPVFEPAPAIILPEVDAEESELISEENIVLDEAFRQDKKVFAGAVNMEAIRLNIEAEEEEDDVKPAEESQEAPVVEDDLESKARQGAQPVMDIPVSEPTIQYIKSSPYLVRSKNGEKVIINKEEFKIGKIPGMADYLLTDNPAVSRMHAIIHKIDGAYYVCDNYSTNATYLNGEKLDAGKNYLLINGVKVSFANDEFTYYMD